MADGATLSRDVALNVLGKIEGYQKELEKVPGVTQKAAAKAALAMQKTFTNDIIKQFKEAEKQAAKTAKFWESVFGAVAGNLGADALKSLVSTVTGAKSEIAALTGEIAMYSRVTGASTETVNALRFAMESGGRTMDELSSVLDAFPDRLEDFRQGGGEVVDLFNILGYSSKDANRLLGDMDGALVEVLGRLQAIENPATRAGLASQLFGDSAIYLTAALGDVPLDEWIERSKIGVDVSERQVRANQDWAATMNVLGEAFNKVKQDATNLVDLAGMAKDAGQAFVVMSSVAIDSVDTMMSQASLLIAAGRAAWNRDWDSAEQAIKEFLSTANRGWTGIIKDAVETGREFRRVADSVGSAAAESDTLNTKLGKTTSSLKEAAAAAAKYDSEIAKLISDQKSWSQTLAEINDDLLTDEEKIHQAAIQRMSAVSEAFGKGVASAEAAKAANLQIAAREQRELAKLHAEQAQERLDFDTEVQQTLRDNEAATAEFTKQLIAERVELFGEFASAVMELTAGIFDLMADARKKDLDRAKKGLDKEKQWLDQLYEARKEVTDKSELDEINSRIRRTKDRIAADRDQIRDAKKAAREVAMMQRGQALFSIGLSTAQAVMMAWATVPPPLNVAAAVAAGVAGATQLALAAAQPLPKFFGGTGQVQAGAGEVPAVLHPREAVLNSRAADALGPQIIDALNAGLAPLALLGGGGGGDVYLDGRRVGQVLAREARRSSRKPTGYRSPYGRN